MHLLDANVPITAHNLYYPLDVVPEFWEWLAHMAEQGEIKMPLDTYEEVKDGSTDVARDPLYGWIRDEQIKASILMKEEADPVLVQQVLEVGYAPDLNDAEIEQIGRDPFLIACALAAPGERIVVTTEASKPNAKRQNRRIPDVCDLLGVTCINTFQMTKSLGFKTSWKKP